MTEAGAPELAGALLPLLRWYRRHGRRLPFREKRDPYRVLVSEIMLQQTTVATMVPYFRRFVRRFPDFDALARSREEDVLATWSGLGYYARARRLRAAAIAVMESFDGRLPAERESLLALPGIGPYTAGAVLAIAFNRPAAAVDGNVARVASRLLALRGDPLLPGTRAGIEAKILASMPRGRARETAEALMELGALICRPRDPDCGACPVRAACVAAARGIQTLIPPPRKRPASRAIRAAYGLVRRDGDVLLRRNGWGEGRLAGLLELPGLWFRTGDARLRLATRLRDLLDAGTTVGPEIASATHAITTHRIAAVLFEVRIPRRALPAGGSWRWGSEAALGELPLSGLSRKLLEASGADRS